MPKKFDEKKLKIIFVTGGVISGLGKGITTASTALLLKSAGYKVTTLKVDMYLNLDAGTINPYEHGEVFVTQDGKETDQDLGNYERFLNQNLKKHNYMTMGQVYYSVIMGERSFKYSGQDIEGHIHIPEEVIRRIFETAEMDKAEIIIVEVGGTVGEYQNVMFFEAVRRLKQRFPGNIVISHVVYLPKPPHLGELKSKPAQASVYDLYQLGLSPDFLICRSETKIDEHKKNLIAFNVGINKDNVLGAENVDSIYKIPKILYEQDYDKKLIKILKLKKHEDLGLMKEWEKMVSNLEKKNQTVKIAIVGKYFSFGTSVLEDAYLCVIEAIKHASNKLNIKTEIQWFDVERFENENERMKIESELSNYQGIIVPQGWGSRGTEGKIRCVKFARENKIPYLGLCFGMQMAVIEFARNVCKLKDATSEEIDQKAKNKVIHIMPDQKAYLEKNQYGGTIRLGAWPCLLNKTTEMFKLYKNFWPKEMLEDNLIQERHRHRYEVNQDYLDTLTKDGLIIAGTSPDGKLVEAIELPKKLHPFFMATQYHPEYMSRPLMPHPLFLGFLKASMQIFNSKS